ncbi:MAG: DPP IV N-terminal domain-containing protein, partial [Bacteroidales bacterium]
MLLIGATLSPRIILTCSVVTAQPGAAQAINRGNYERAESFLSATTSKLVFNENITPVWINQSCFWYLSHSRDGNWYTMVDAATGDKRELFDHTLLAEELTGLTGHTYIPGELPLRNLTARESGEIDFMLSGEWFTWSNAQKRFLKAMVHPVYSGDGIISPDGSMAAFIRDYNLWTRDMTTGEEKQLTYDGIEDLGYATNNAGWSKSDRPVLKWSPDSRKIATFRHDGRGVGEMYLATTSVGHPELERWKYPLPGDSLI